MHAVTLVATPPSSGSYSYHVNKTDRSREARCDRESSSDSLAIYVAAGSALKLTAPDVAACGNVANVAEPTYYQNLLSELRRQPYRRQQAARWRPSYFFPQLSENLSLTMLGNRPRMIEGVVRVTIYAEGKGVDFRDVLETYGAR